MASWAGVLAALDSDLALAAAVVNALDTAKPPFEVVRGEPWSLLDRQLRYWYDGDQESETGGRTLTRNNVQEKVVIRWYWPVVNRADSRWVSDLEGQLQAANRATQKYLLLDQKLKDAGTENAIGVSWEGGTSGWQQMGEMWVRVLSLSILIDMAWTEDIGTL